MPWPFAGTGIAYAGAGANLTEALAPAIVERNGIRFGMVAFCDHQEDFAAGSARQAWPTWISTTSLVPCGHFRKAWSTCRRQG